MHSASDYVGSYNSYCLQVFEPLIVLAHIPFDIRSGTCTHVLSFCMDSQYLYMGGHASENITSVFYIYAMVKTFSLYETQTKNK